MNNKKKLHLTYSWDVDTNETTETKIKNYEPPESIFKDTKNLQIVNDRCYNLFDFISTTITFKGYAFLAELMQKSENRIACEESVNECLRKGFKVISENNNNIDRTHIINELEDELKKFEIQSVIQRAGLMGESMGVGHIAVKIKNDDLKGEISKPMPIHNVKIKQDSLERFVVIDPIWITPKNYNTTDPMDVYFYKPENWLMINKEIHSDRIYQVIPYPLPDILKPSYNFGGLSLIQMMIPYVDNWEIVRDEVREIIKTYRTYILSTDTNALIESRSQFDRRMRQFTEGKNNHGILVISNTEDEKMEQTNTNLSQLSELVDNYLQQLCIPSRLSCTKLTGIQPHGLNANGEGEKKSFHEIIASKQEKIYKPVLNWIIKILMLNKYGQIYDDIVIDFVPLDEIDEVEASQINKQNAETDNIYVNLGVLNPEQVNKKIANDKNSGYGGVNYKPVDHEKENELQVTEKEEK